MATEVRCRCGRVIPLRDAAGAAEVRCPACRRWLAVPHGPPRSIRPALDRVGWGMAVAVGTVVVACGVAGASVTLAGIGAAVVMAALAGLAAARG